MRSVVKYEEILLLSEKDSKAKKIIFSENKNILFGVNGMGKSRVIKHLLWCLGADAPLRDAGGFDTNIVCALTFSINKTKYIIVRQNKKMGFFKHEKQERIFSCATGKEWSEFFANYFNFQLKLQRNDDGEFDFAGPEYALLPFYIDQDSSWSNRWSTFSHLGQFQNWQSTVFSHFTGIKSPLYLSLKLRYDEQKMQANEFKRQIKSNKHFHDKVLSLLPEKKLTLNSMVFKKEISELAKSTENLTIEQANLSSDIIDVASQRQKLNTELRLAIRAEKETFGDIEYLSKYDDNEELECPTCGTIHMITFHSRLSLSDEAEQLHQFIVKTKEDIEALVSKEKKLKEKYNAISGEINSIRRSSKIEHNGISLENVIDSRSGDILQEAMALTTKVIEEEIKTANTAALEYQFQMDLLLDTRLEKEIRGYCRGKYKDFSSKLLIDRSESSEVGAIGSRPTTTGSSGPRGILALHCSLIATSSKYTENTVFPFVVDTPQQSGQDESNLIRMLDTSLGMSRYTGQVIVATETIPKDWQHEGVNIIHLKVKRGLLSNDQYESSIKFIAPLLQSINDYL
jgi:RNA polymerase-binding transcription factor DksA